MNEYIGGYNNEVVEEISRLCCVQVTIIHVFLLTVKLGNTNKEPLIVILSRCTLIIPTKHKITIKISGYNAQEIKWYIQEVNFQKPSPYGQMSSIEKDI